MPAQLPTTDFQKLILQKCKLYKGTYVRDPFSGKLQKELIGIIDSIQEIANDDRSTRDNELSEKFGMMDTAIKAGWRVYYGRELTQAEIELHTLPLKNLKIDIEAALSEKKRAADLQQRIVLQQQQLQDAAKQENQQLRLQIQRLESELRESKAQLASLQEKTTAKINSLESALQAATDENTRLKESLKDAQNLVLAADGKVAAADGKVAAAERRAAAAEERVSEADKKAAVANGRVSAADASAAKAKQQATELQQRVDLQEARLQQVGDENQRLQVQLEQSKKLASEQSLLASEKEKEFSSKLLDKDRELESLQARELAANEKASQANSESLELQKQISQLQQKLELQKQTLTAQGVASNVALQSQIDSLKQQLQQKEAELQAKEKLLQLAQVTNQTLSGENGNLRVNNVRLASENEKLKQQVEVQRLGLASQQNLTERVTSQAEELKALQAKLEEADATAKAKEELAGELQRQLGSQATELKQFRDDNGALQSRLSSVESQLDEKTKILAAKDAELQAKTRAVEQRDEEIGRLKDEALRLIEAQSLGATDKTELARLKGLVEEKDEKIKQLESGNTTLAAENAELNQRNLDLEQLRNRNGELIAEKAALAAKVASLGAENERLKAQSTESEAKQEQQKDQLAALTAKLEQQESQIQALLNQDEQNRNTIKSLSEDKAVLILQRDRLKEKIAELRQQKEQITPDGQDSSSEHNILPAIGLIEGARATVAEVTAELDDHNHTLVQPEDPSSLSPLKKFTEEFTSGSMLEHKYAEDDTGTKFESSSYDRKNTENKFKNDGGEEVAALLADRKTIVLEGDPPQKMRYTKDLDKDPTILAGALTLEGISESQPKGGHSVQATMEDCDDHPEFILDVLIKFHERLNENLKKKSTEELENVHCTTIDYKGDNLMIRNIIDSHNKAAKQINSGELKTKKFQSNQMVEQLRNQKAIASQALPEDLKRRVSDQEQNRSRLRTR